MADNIPAKLKAAQIAPFAKRAAQLERFKPIIAYWLRFYIVQKIISASLHSADAECTAYTTDLMEQLERTKADNPNEDALLDEVAAYAYCEQFALQTFAKGEREMTANMATKNTADTLLAASIFLEMLAIWKKDPEPEIKSKLKFAKYHAVRILKAIQAGEDPNLTNPAREPPPQAAAPATLDPNDPEVQNINQGSAMPPAHNPYQAYVETGPNTSAQPSPTYSAPNVSPPPDFPSAPTGYGSHRDVSPISQPSTSRKGSVVSAGGGYFPRVDVPTFTADNAAPSLPTATSNEDEPMADAFNQSSLPTDSQLPQAPQPPSPQNYYQNASSPPPFQPQQSPSPHNPYQAPPQQPGFASQPPFQHSQPPAAFQPPPQQQFQYASQQPQPPQPPPQQYQQAYTHAPQALRQGPFKTDEESQMEATKHAKWAISALNFEDVDTAVKQLRLALRALGAN
ncbi:DUF605-domain-containing protein [Lentithecium fluviatile CBS 122367]|uniref:DUF605-domain-containing protein n=1 Tax=Lentithecium fluviatile CBS 122367 TaxID=1168545 RepID=A0A6G1IX10_9PLEO|nr:DUF605-domain-containing protein [Lentithecium fluviatile CBS 122367]